MTATYDIPCGSRTIVEKWSHPSSCAGIRTRDGRKPGRVPSLTVRCSRDPYLHHCDAPRSMCRILSELSGSNDVEERYGHRHHLSFAPQQTTANGTNREQQILFVKRHHISRPSNRCGMMSAYLYSRRKLSPHGRLEICSSIRYVPLEEEHIHRFCELSETLCIQPRNMEGRFPEGVSRSVKLIMSHECAVKIYFKVKRQAVPLDGPSTLLRTEEKMVHADTGIMLPAPCNGWRICVFSVTGHLSQSHH